MIRRAEVLLDGSVQLILPFDVDRAAVGDLHHDVQAATSDRSVLIQSGGGLHAAVSGTEGEDRSELRPGRKFELGPSER